MDIPPDLSIFVLGNAVTSPFTPWDLPDPPPDACFPRIATPNSGRGVGTYGPEMLAWCDERRLNSRRSSGWRWWQRYVAYRALEHDEAGRLIWDVVVLSGPRQIGKSWFERGLCSWRLVQGGRFGEEQTILHVAHKLIAAKETWRPAARWATATDGFGVRWAAGEESIENRSDGSRWMLQAASDGAGVAFSLSMALVDEAWRIRRQVVDGAIAPTLAEATSPQLWLVSTAGTSESDLMASNRAAGLARLELDDPGSLLLIEWSAPPEPELDIDDPAVWRAASPFWDERRAERVARARERSSEYEFRQQWLNQWVPTVRRAVIEPALWDETVADGGPVGVPCFGVGVAPDRSAGCVVACGGGVVEVVRAEAGVGWLAGEVRRLVERWDPPAVCADPGGPAVTVVAELAGELGDRLVAAKTRDVVAACAGLYDAVNQRRRCHRSHPELDAAAKVARKRAAGGAWMFDGTDGGHLLVAAALAHWADRVAANTPASEGWFVA